MSEHQGSTDETTMVRLPSAIEQVQWTEPMAAPGGLVGLEVFTHFVGNNAELEIQLRDHHGRNHGTFRDKIYGNAFIAEIRVPAGARSALYADVELPAHGLAMSSGALLLLPTVEVTNARWSQPRAHRSDVVTLMADVSGAPDGMQAEIVILEHDDDGVHDLVTTFPTHVEGNKVEAEWTCVFHDTGHIPRADESPEGYRSPMFIFTVTVAGGRAVSGPLELRDWMDIEVRDGDDEPMAGASYLLHLPDGSTRAGTLDEDGKAFEKELPPGPVTVEVKKKKEGRHG